MSGIGESFQSAHPPKSVGPSPLSVALPVPGAPGPAGGFRVADGEELSTTLRRLAKPAEEMLADARESLADARERERQAAQELRAVERMVSVPPRMPADPTPATMPRWRNYLARHCGHLEDASAVKRAIDVADLYWVAPAMVDVAEAASMTLPDYDAAWAARPSDYGLMWFGRRLVRESYYREGVRKSDDIGCVAVRWRPRGDGFEVHGYVHIRDLAAHLAEVSIVRPGTRDERINWTLNAAMGPGGTGAWINNDDPATIRRGDPIDPSQPLAAVVASAWLLMGQTMVTETRAAAIDPKIRREERRGGRPDPTVTVIELRRSRGETGGDHPGRDYHHRWMVSGHWRNQPWGTGRTQRRPVWISAYVKGPDDAPLLVTEKVKLWRR